MVLLNEEFTELATTGSELQGLLLDGDDEGTVCNDGRLGQLCAFILSENIRMGGLKSLTT